MPNEADNDATTDPSGIGVVVSHHHKGDKFSDSDQKGLMQILLVMKRLAG